VQGLHHAFNVVTAQFAWNADWLVGSQTVNPFNGAVTSVDAASFPVWWFAFAAALVLAWRAGGRSARAFGAVLAISVAASIVAISRTTGPMFEYRLRFVWVLGMLTAVFVVWMAWTVLARRRWWPARAAHVALLVLVIASSGYNVARAAGTARPNQHQGRVAAVLSDQLLHRLPRGHGVVLFNVESFGAGPLITGMMLRLERRGIPVALRNRLDDRLRFGEHRMLRGRPVRTEIRVAVNDEIERVRREPCVRELAYWGQRPRAQRTAALRAIRRIERRLAAHTITGRQAIHGLARYTSVLPAAAVFRVHAPGPGC
jgi:hypothetical protein